ncbi:hypothetical protein RDWZM_006019 [Blomia tropicalis]|uniref:Uncharacterized protein n=1 Tax=Blomia tropicalis TaxID=40697 RepID=A0A9Q0M732_BLOTA|nr:hypothetical protein RDWZM_006019 [Blomia tropicalis]
MNSEHQEIAAILSFNLVAPVRMRSSLKHQSMAWVETTIRSNVDRIGAVDRRVRTDTHTRKLSTVYSNNHQPVSHFSAIIQIQDFKLYSYICAFISFVGDDDVQ